MTRPILLLLVISVLASGCGNDASDNSASTVVTQISGNLYDDALTPCELLTPAMVAAEAGIDVDEIENPIVMGQLCSYGWDGGQADISAVRFHESAEAAHEFYERLHRELTPEERAEAEAMMNEEFERQRADGEFTDEQAELAEGLGGILAEMDASEQKEAIEGIGDRAIYGWSVTEMELPFVGTVYTTHARIYILDGNLTFDVSGLAVQSDPQQRPSDDMLEANRAFTISLAQRVLAEAR